MIATSIRNLTTVAIGEMNKKNTSNLFVLQSDGVVEKLNEVRSDLDAGNVDDDRFGRIARLRGSGIVDGDHPEAVHDPVPEIGPIDVCSGP